METVRDVSLVVALVTTGLMAGLYLAFSVAVMPGLARAEDRTFVVAMRAVNAAILNGWFLVVFLGPLVLDVVAVASRLPGHDQLVTTALALALYAVTLGITGRVNVPLNDRLDHTEPAAQARAVFERRWVRWNAVRTVVCTASFVVLALAATQR